MYIYFLKNTANNKIYIGSTKDFQRRKLQHFNMLRNNTHTNKNIANDLLFFDVNDFEMILISDLTGIKISWLQAIEELYIAHLYTSFKLLFLLNSSIYHLSAFLILGLFLSSKKTNSSIFSPNIPDNK